jgi:hypothetical protein
MERTFIEKLILVIAWVGLIGGILFSILYSKDVFESGAEMCFPTGVAYLVSGIGLSIGCWAILLELVAISDRLRKLEDGK